MSDNVSLIRPTKIITIIDITDLVDRIRQHRHPVTPDDGVTAMSFNTPIDWDSHSPEQQCELLVRPVIFASESISRTTVEILENVKNNGDRALREYSTKLDKTGVGALCVTEEEIQ